MNEVDDVELLARARRGEEDAFTQLFAGYQRAIYRYAAHMCGPGSADDIVQETFLAVLRQTGRYDKSRGPLVAYLFGIARHCALKRLAWDTSKNETESGSGEEGCEHPTILDDLSRAEAIVAVRDAVQSLPEVYREAVVLCDLEELDYAVAAQVMQCPLGTVRSRLHRARSLLTAKLASQRVVQARRS